MSAPKSHLEDTGRAPLPYVVREAPLGDGTERKNRGRYQVVGAAAVRLLDVTGEDQLAQQLTVHASLKRVDGWIEADERDLPRGVLHAHWGTDGAAHDAEIDLLQGACFSVAASSLRVDAQIEDAGQQANVAISVGYYPSRCRPQRTRRIENLLENGGAQFVTVPPFARSVSILIVPSALVGGIAVQIVDQTLIGGLGGVFSAAYPIVLPLPNGAARILVVNPNAVPIPRVLLVFELEI